MSDKKIKYCDVKKEFIIIEYFEMTYEISLFLFNSDYNSDY